MATVRTTVSIDDRLLAQAKALAAQTRQPVGAVIDDALRVLFSPARVQRPAGRVRLPTDGGSGLQPGIDLEDRDQLAQILGDNDPGGGSARAAR